MAESSEPVLEEPVQEQPEVIITVDERLSKIEQQMLVADKNFDDIGKAYTGLLQQLEPLIRLSAQIQAQQAAQAQNPNQPQRQNAGIPDRIGNIIEKALTETKSYSPLESKFNKFAETILDAAIDRATKPSKFDQYLEDEIAKQKAKTMAAAMHETS